MVTVQLSNDDALLVREQLIRRADDLDRELVRTDAPTMQHELARDVERLRRVIATLDGLGSTPA